MTQENFSKWFTLSKVRKENPLPPHTDLGQLANDFGEFFHRKIELFRTEIDDIPVQPPSVEYEPPKVELTSFRQLKEEEIRDIIMNSSNATCKLDPIPTWLVKLCVDELKTVITKIINMPLHDGYVPEAWKVAILVPILKKLGLEALFENFRPVNNLSFVSKIAEKAVVGQMLNHCEDNAPLPINQSAYRPFNSTETALVKVQSDILMSIDQREVTLLVLLDLSAAFDTVDHEIMLELLKSNFGVSGDALGWLKYFMSDRKQFVSVNQVLSNCFPVTCGVPQGSCLGPILFLFYVSKLFEIIKKHLPSSHGYADDTQLYLSFCPESPVCQNDAVKVVETCITEVRAWLVSQKLKFNDLKTEFLIIGTRQQLKNMEINSVRVGDVNIKPAESVRDLGAWFDKNMSRTFT